MADGNGVEKASKTLLESHTTRLIAYLIPVIFSAAFLTYQVRGVASAQDEMKAQIGQLAKVVGELSTSLARVDERSLSAKDRSSSVDANLSEIEKRVQHLEWREGIYRQGPRGRGAQP